MPNSSGHGTELPSSSSTPGFIMISEASSKQTDKSQLLSDDLNVSDSHILPNECENHYRELTLPKNSFPIKSVKKAKIKELTPIKLHNQVILEEDAGANDNVILPPPPTHRRNLYEKKIATRNTRSFRRKKNSSKAWYDLSDEEDSLTGESRRINHHHHSHYRDNDKVEM